MSTMFTQPRRLVYTNLGAMAFALTMQALYEGPAIWSGFLAARGPLWAPALLLVVALFALPGPRHIGMVLLTRLAIVGGTIVMVVSALGLLVFWVLSWPW